MPQELPPTYDNLHALNLLGSCAHEIKDEDGTVLRVEVAPDLPLDADGAPVGYAAAAAGLLGALRKTLRDAVDARAEALRLTLITPGSGQAMEYQEAFNEAVQVSNALAADPAASIDAGRFPMLAASIGFDRDPSTGVPTVDVPGEARSVLAAYDAYQRAGAAIRAARLRGKAAIDAAPDATAARAALTAIAWPIFG